MTTRPILFSGPMVRALLAGTKTQTRRVVKWRGLEPGLNLQFSGLSVERSGSNFVLTSATRTSHEYRSIPQPCPYGQPGDRLWVREAHWWFKDEPDHSCGYYPPKLTAEDVMYRADGDDGRRVWRPSIHMPRWASRITLEITGVRVERLNSISVGDAIAEGIPRGGPENPDGIEQREYRELWESINGPGSWALNPWVWVISFHRVEKKHGSS